MSETKSPAARQPRRAKKRSAAGQSTPRRSRAGKAVRNAERKWWQYELTPAKVKSTELMNFSRQASSYVSAGISILDAIASIGAETKDKTLRRMLFDIHTNVSGGMNFADAVSIHGDVLPEYYVHMLQSAEYTGRLDDTLDRLSQYLERDIESRRKIKSALTYPCIVGVMSMITVVVLAGFVLPRFRTFFESLGAKLPLVTRMLLAATGALTTFWYVPLALFMIAVFLLVGSMRFENMRRMRDRAIFKVPALGVLVRYLVVERFCRVMSAMVHAGVPLSDALSVAGATTNNRTFQIAIAEAREEMIQGGGLSAPLAVSGLFPPAANQMIRVGEATGTLDKQLESASSYFEKELNYRLKRFTDMFEPVMILFVGFIVGFVAIALVAAMYGIYNQVDI